MSARICFAVGLLVSNVASATDWYVDAAAAGNESGTSWADAWTDLAAIDWNAIDAGDTLFLSGGTAGRVYAGDLAASRSGGQDQRITISRSNDTGHDGSVTISSVQVSGSYVTLDGLDWSKFLVDASHTGYTIRVTGDNFVLRNAKLVGDFSGLWGTTLYATAPYLTVERCWFDGNSQEDMIKYDPPGSGKLTIAGSLFVNNRGPEDGTHRDVVQTSGGYGFDVEVHHSIFWNTADVLLHQSDGNRFGDFLLYYNVFAETGDVLKLSNYAGADSALVHNNIFIHNRDLLGYTGGSEPQFANNIFVGPSHFDGPLHMDLGVARNNLFSPGTEYLVSGNGNLEQAPLFIDAQQILGADGIPFTADDGLHPALGSPAIENGTSLGYLVDITGRSISGNPDIGAYEYLPPATDAGLAVDSARSDANRADTSTLVDSSAPVDSSRPPDGARPDAGAADRGPATDARRQDVASHDAAGADVATSSDVVSLADAAPARDVAGNENIAAGCSCRHGTAAPNWMLAALCGLLACRRRR